MVNVTVINKKDAIKYLVRIGIIIIIVGILIRYFSSLKGKEISNMEKTNIQNTMAFISCLDDTIPTIEQVNKKNSNENNVVAPLKLALVKELGILDSVEKKYNLNETKEENIASSIKDVSVNENSREVSNEDLDEEEEIKQAKTNVETEVLKSNVPNKYTNTYNTVQIKNESKHTLTQEMLNAEEVKVNNKNILIFHTHTCESYTETEENNYNESGNFRTTDLNFSVSKVGEELKNQLDSYGYNVIHNNTYHDYPAYSGSYERSLTTVKNLLSNNKEFDVVFDIHRDAIGDSTYAPTVRIGDEYAAQLMFVIGTDGSGLEHNNWIENLKFAIKLQEKANEMYPGLFKPIIVRDSRYNQHLSKAASIIEVGATGNTLEQANTSMKYLARVISEVMK